MTYHAESIVKPYANRERHESNEIPSQTNKPNSRTKWRRQLRAKQHAVGSYRFVYLLAVLLPLSGLYVEGGGGACRLLLPIRRLENDVVCASSGAGLLLLWSSVFLSTEFGLVLSWFSRSSWNQKARKTERTVNQSLGSALRMNCLYGALHPEEGIWLRSWSVSWIFGLCLGSSCVG